MPWILGLLALVLLVLVVIAFSRGVFSLFVYRDANSDGLIVWEDMAPAPLGEEHYTPQGMVWVDGRLILANTWKNTNSRVYEYDPGTMEIRRYFDMPPEAVHTSGLAWHEGALWGVDYKSNRAYRMDYEESFSSGTAVVTGSFDTGLEGTSACTFLEVDDEWYFAVSDFMNTRQTIVVRHEQALEDGTAEDAVFFAYRNENFSQGLEYINGFLYESENKFRTNIINKMDVDLLRSERDARKATVAQFLAPHRGVEDLAWDGEHVWTSDEVSFRIYRGEFDCGQEVECGEHRGDRKPE